MIVNLGLSERLKMMRSDRPDEWQMDELSNYAKQYEQMIEALLENIGEDLDLMEIFAPVIEGDL